jgi:hypothetical protein
VVGNSSGIISVNPSTCLERLRKPRRRRSQGSQCSDRDSNRAPFDYNSERIYLEPTSYWNHHSYEEVRYRVKLWRNANSQIKYFNFVSYILYISTLVSDLCLRSSNCSHLFVVYFMALSVAESARG